MKDEELKQISWDFRCGIIGENGSPESMCFAVSAPLAGYLRSMCGLDVEVWQSDHEGVEGSQFYEHVWIKLADGRVLDPTFDQFCSEEPVPIYLGKPTEFHGQAKRLE